VPLSEGFFFSNEGVKEGYPLKRRYFAYVGLFSVKTVADRYKLHIITSIGDRLSRLISTNDLV